jgi:hypothetical protein
MAGTNSKRLAAVAMGGAAALSAFVTGTIVWLWMTDPARVAAAAATGGDPLMFVRVLARFLSEAISLAIRYL